MSRECLNSLRVIGTILIFTPLLVALPAILYAVITGKNVGIGGDGGAGYAAGLMIAAGLVTLTYVSVKEFKKK